MDISIKYQFQYIHPVYGQYQDTLYFDFDDFKDISSEKFEDHPEVMKKRQERIDAWIKQNENPPQEQEKTAEELQQEIDDLAVQQTELETRQQDLESKISEVLTINNTKWQPS